MVAVAESTPGPVAINSVTYIGYKIAGFAGATMSTLAVCIPSFFIIYGISLFFDQFLSLRWVSCAFRGIQVCVIYLILTAGLKMLKSIDKNTLNLTLLTLVMASLAGHIHRTAFRRFGKQRRQQQTAAGCAEQSLFRCVDRAFRVPPFGNWWMGWRFTTSFWAEKKQETFFRFPARCAAVWAAGI